VCGHRRPGQLSAGRHHAKSGHGRYADDVRGQLQFADRGRASLVGHAHRDHAWPAGTYPHANGHAQHGTTATAADGTLTAAGFGLAGLGVLAGGLLAGWALLGRRRRAAGRG
jgi:hypothetical protein